MSYLVADVHPPLHKMPLSEPYTHSAAFDAGFLQVSQIHQIHYEQYGKKDGRPVLYVHGGPGGSATYDQTGYFDPSVYRVVLFDQRGAGKSAPAAELRENNSQLLVADMETLRRRLRIQQWFMVFGGSWGSTLSLLYAQAHPDRVDSLVLRGIFTERKAELRFSRGHDGAARVFPEAYESFIQYLPPEDRADPYAAYYKLVTSDDQETRLAASKSWCQWDLSIMKLIPEKDAIASKNDTWSLQHARLETHYAVNNGFMQEGQLLSPESLAKIRHIRCKTSIAFLL